MSKKGNKRNTKKFRKNLNQKRLNQKPKSKKVSQTVTLSNPKQDLPKLTKKIWKNYHGGDVFGEDVEDILYITSYKKLPLDVQSQIEKHIKKYPIRRGNCHPNSTLLSLNIKGINTCRGWYSDNVFSWYEMVKQEFPSLIKHYSKVVKHIEKQKSKGIKWIKTEVLHTSDEKCWVNTTNGTFYLSHSWNEYNGVHFDLTSEFQKPFKTLKDWKYYKLKSKDDYQSIVENTEYNNSSKHNLHSITSMCSGSGIYELTYDDTYFIMNQNYNPRYTKKIPY